MKKDLDNINKILHEVACDNEKIAEFEKEIDKIKNEINNIIEINKIKILQVELMYKRKFNKL